jgi:citrate synthase
MSQLNEPTMPGEGHMAETTTKARKRGDYLSRSEALEILRIKPQTLYCYVSRGYIRSVPQPGGRTSYYLREDVERVKAKSVARSGHGPAAASAMRWGEPVIETSVTEITEDGPRYRSRLAVDLARSGASFESVAEYLWSGDWSDNPRGWDAEDRVGELPTLLATRAKLFPRAHILQLFSGVALALGVVDDEHKDPTPCARRLIRAMTGAFGFLGREDAYVALDRGESIAHGLARALGIPTDPARLRALDTALVLIADHELNPATFVARVAASAGSHLHACVGAALGVWVGSLIGLTCDQLEDMFAPGIGADKALARARAMLGEGSKLPGFDLPVYPNGDPRAEALIDLAREIDLPAVADMLDAVQRIEQELELRPVVEIGLVVLCRALGAPAGAAGGVFALGRVAGWVAHVLEQREQSFLIRPRAQFARSAARSLS